MPNGIHKVAIYPEMVLKQYDMEYTAIEFITFIAIAGKNKLESYRTRVGHWHYMQPNLSPDLG